MRIVPPLYHLSFNKNLPLTLKPRLPDGSDLSSEKTVVSEFETPRVSFSPSIYGCLLGIYSNISQLMESPKGQKEGCEFAVYRFDPRSKARILFPEDLTEKRLVWDAHVTKEHCFLDAVDIYYCGHVIALVENSVPGLTIYPYNDKSLVPVENTLFEDATFRQTVRLRGDKYKLKFF